jgi:ribosomal protein S18 acetylase RimI-like enzyme
MTARSVVLRAPVLDDAAGIAAVRVAGWRQTYGHLLPSRFYDDAELTAQTQLWQARLRAGPQPRLQVADDGGVVVGFAAAGPATDDHPARELQLYALYVRSDHQRSGVGGRLLDAVCGREPAQLWVAKENPNAHAFYGKHGFRSDGVEQVDPDLDDLVEVRFVR